MAEAYIYDAVRSPRGKGRKDGSLHEVTSVRLSAQMLNAIKSRNDLEGHAVEDVIWGNVTQVGEQGGCLARTAVLASMDEASADYQVTETGRPYALIPTTSIIKTAAGTVEAISSTLAFEDEGVWYLVRIDDPQQIALLTQVYPDFNGITFPQATMRPVE